MRGHASKQTSLKIAYYFEDKKIHVTFTPVKHRTSSIEIMAKHLETGKKAELLSGLFLEENGYEIIARNYRFGRGEIDLIAKKGIFIVFVEVKSLTNIKFGNPEISVTKNKIKLVTKTAEHFVSSLNWQQQIRFDIISVIFKREKDFEITHFEDAFY